MSGSQERDDQETRRAGRRDRGGAHFVDLKHDCPIVRVHHSKIGGDREGERAIPLTNSQKIDAVSPAHLRYGSGEPRGGDGQGPGRRSKTFRERPAGRGEIVCRWRR